MDLFDYDVIHDLYDDLKKERIKYKEDLEESKSRIREIDNYLAGLFSKDENDVQVFLARKVENLYREEIEYMKREKDKLSIRCECIEDYIHRLDMKIAKLRKLLFDNPSMLHVKHLLGPSSVDILTDIIQKIKSIAIYVDDNSNRVKDDLKDIEMQIYKVIENLKNV